MKHPEYVFLENYFREKGLTLSARVLPVVEQTMRQAAQEQESRFHSTESHVGYFYHALAVCRMLVDLHLPLNREEEDTMLAAAICHILPENLNLIYLEQQLMDRFFLSEAAAKIVTLLFRDDAAAEGDQTAFFRRVQANRLAMLIKLADRGNLSSQLYGLSGKAARSYINETKAYLLPMCIYAKEHYPELTAPVDVMMEKMRTLTEAAEVLLVRYETQAAELNQQILALREENLTLRRMIQSMQA